jgi:hypothetical protein
VLDDAEVAARNSKKQKLYACADEIDECAKFRSHGFMFRWNGRSGASRNEVQDLLASNFNWRAQLLVYQTSPWFKALFAQCGKFCKGLAEKCEWPQWSGKMEFSLNRQSPHNFVHFHPAVTDYPRRHRMHPPGFFKWRGSMPQIVPSYGRGRSPANVLNAVHYYCQAP